MIKKGEIEDDHTLDNVEEKEDWVEQDARERISESLFSGASHLNKQRSRGINSSARTDKIIKLILLLFVLSAVCWYLYS